VKEIDETPVPESESEVDRVIAANAVYALERLDELRERIDRLLVRISNLETQRTPQDENDDPEWFG